MSGKLASSSAFIFAARLAGAGIIFLAQAAIARLWGASILGEYLLVTATINLIGVVMPFGFHTVGSYFAAQYRAKDEGRMLWRFFARSYGHVFVAMALLLLLGRHVLPLFGAPGQLLLEHWVPASLMAFATAMVHVNGSILIGLKRPFAGFLADAVFRPMVIIAAFAVSLLAVTPAAGFEQMLWIMSIGYIGIASVHFVFAIRAARTVPAEGGIRAGESKRWWRFALPWVLISLATDFFFDIDLLLLSSHLSREELAIFGVCTRMFSLISFGVAAVYAVILPDMFESEAKSDRTGFNRKIGDANLVAVVISLAMLVLMTVAAPFALMLFGPAFVAGAAPMSVLCLALVVRSVFGPASVVLSIHDRPYASLPSIGLGMGTLVIANMVLVPPFGLMGAAVSALLAIGLWNIALWYTALKTAGIDVSILPRIRKLRSRTAVSESV
jgi:O-antigen/teichoic acid export membrane protein